ncbi:MAG TPA: type I-U CRISPR-associated protein Csb2 [Acetobacteraceae bacterium]|nr:type I-U CRISPR-associated protein Csb2 [Acetobacteraceae bacterium]
MLVLDIEWLLGVCFAARAPSDAAPDWPPQPDRVFSALIASWGARGERQEERAALEWLETQPAPGIAAVPHTRRATATTFVPPNDAAITDIRILPDRRRRQPRQFPAATLHGGSGEPHLRITWQSDPSPNRLAALRALAQDTSYVGHSNSLVRCTFSEQEPEHKADLLPAGTTAAPYPGRLRELAALYARHIATADANARPHPALLPDAKPVETASAPGSVFGKRWVVLRFVDGDCPDLRAAAVVGRRMREALMSVWPDAIPEWLSGHAPDRSPTREPHLAVIPLSDVGFAHSDTARQSWHGMALVLPRKIEAMWTGTDTPEVYANRQTLESALSPEQTDGVLVLLLGRLGKCHLRVVAAPESSGLSSLRPSRYLQESRLWSTVTPVALDRHPKSDQPREETAAIIRESCTRIGLPPPEVVHVHKHAAIAGAPSAWPPGGAPHWTGWARPGPLADRPLTHATLRFKDKVAGPVILGSGRFFGLGLCLPVAERAGS